ncbi:DNA methyltransferase [Roseiflexus castenholzii]|jgi:DNA modification methylase|nr:DNA methyltransferase [Roseiflexus castenholzii]
MTPSLDLENQVYIDRLCRLLEEDLDFHDQDSGYASHNIHSFPAKFPPQLPRKFIQALTLPGETVLDPMMGSGTTVLEAFLLGRRGIGFDIDPLAVMLAKAKVSPISHHDAVIWSREIISNARESFFSQKRVLYNEIDRMWDEETREFVDYWFSREVQLALTALVVEINRINDENLRNFFNVILSSIIITKSGGVSLALDLAHTRPHRVDRAIDWNGCPLEMDTSKRSERRKLSKKIRSPFEEFEKKCMQSLKNMSENGLNSDQLSMRCLPNWENARMQPDISMCNAKSLLLNDECVDIIITSPPYASHAIDYMRAHKFSLVWLGYAIRELSERRKRYIGGDALEGHGFESLPGYTSSIIDSLARRDPRKSLVLRRYYSEMKAILREMFRVLKKGRVAIVVVGESKLRGQDVEIDVCLSEIGESLGFFVPRIGVRRLDRNRRMMPVGNQVDMKSQIQRRMHKEFVIGFYKPPID